MPLIEGRTYLTSMGRQVTVGGPTKDHPELIYTYGGEWFDRKTGKTPRKDGKGPHVIDDYDLPPDVAALRFQAARQLFFDVNSSETVERYMVEEMRNFKIRIAMHKQGVPLEMFNDLVMVDSIIADLEVSVGESIWDCFEEYAAARKIHQTLKFK